MKKKLLWLLLLFLMLLLLPFASRLFLLSGEEARPAADFSVSSGEEKDEIQTASGLSLSQGSNADGSLTDSAKTLSLQALSVKKSGAAPQDNASAGTSRRRETAEDSSFRIYDSGTGEILTVSDRECLIGMLACEMDPNTPREALKAQAVASYTTCCKLRQEQMKSGSDKYHGADFDANPMIWLRYTAKAQMRLLWGGKYSANRKKLEAAVDDVLGQVLHYDGVLISAPYYAVSSGKTENSREIWGGEEPYLVSVDSPWDKASPDYKTVKTVSKAEFKAAVSEAYPECRFPDNAKEWIDQPERTAAGSVRSLRIGGETLDGIQVRNLFGLPSSHFTIQYKNGTFTIEITDSGEGMSPENLEKLRKRIHGEIEENVGTGNGVGLSQYGAAAMAKKGKTCEEILEWYYPGTVLCK